MANTPRSGRARRLGTQQGDCGTARATSTIPSICPGSTCSSSTSGDGRRRPGLLGDLRVDLRRRPTIRKPVEQYDGTLGVTTAFVNAHQKPAVQVQWNSNLGSIYTNPGDVNGVRWGSGTMISANLMLTCGHLFDADPNGWTVPRQNGTSTAISPQEIATNMHVNFLYQVDSTGTLRAEQTLPDHAADRVPPGRARHGDLPDRWQPRQHLRLQRGLDHQPGGRRHAGDHRPPGRPAEADRGRAVHDDLGDHRALQRHRHARRQLRIRHPPGIDRPRRRRAHQRWVQLGRHRIELGHGDRRHPQRVADAPGVARQGSDGFRRRPASPRSRRPTRASPPTSCTRGSAPTCSGR